MKKIISFSIWGDIRLYCIGAIKNALLAKKYFPDWICRYYYDISVPKIIIDYLSNLSNVEFFFVDIPSGAKIYKDNGQFGMFWRFYPFNDDDVEVWMSRDIDSRISEYEAIQINDFLQSNKVLHTFSDSNEPICRGGTVTFRNYINSHDTRIVDGIKLDINTLTCDQDKINCKFYDDEKFLNNVLFPYYKQSFIRTNRVKHNNERYFNTFTGSFTGQILDEYDKPYDKNRDSSFNRKNSYDDLYVLLDEYKARLNTCSSNVYQMYIK